MNDSDYTHYWFDTEFIEDGTVVIPLSIGIVCEDGRELYLEWYQDDLKLAKANEFVVANVFPHLRWKNGDPSAQRWHYEIRNELIEFVNAGAKRPLFWAWYATYDWMVMCQTFGNMTDLPQNWPMFPMDLRAIIEWEGGKRRFALPSQEGTAHEALDDARHLKAMYDHLGYMRKLEFERKVDADLRTSNALVASIEKRVHALYVPVVPTAGPTPSGWYRRTDEQEPSQSTQE